jgi:RNA methyltransferase, TrmH family
VKRAASLSQRKFRDREGAFLVEGADLVMAGLAAGHRPQMVFVRAERAEELVVRLGLSGEAGRVSGARPAGGAAAPGRSGASPAAAGPPPAVYPVAEHVAHKIGTLETPADVMAVFPLPGRRPFAPPPGSGADLLVVYADAVGDPGNVGTLLRAAVAFGAAAFVAAPGTADLYAPKTVRAGMGAVFAFPLYQEVLLSDLVARLPGAEVVGLVAHDGEPLDRAALRRPAVLVIGAERAGISAQAASHVTRPVTIALAPDRPQAVESLNAGVAGSIALYEFSRRRAGAVHTPPSAAAKEG